jgi:hypothetical protein
MESSCQPFDGKRGPMVDIFLRPDGTFGFEEFRRDPEDRGAWTPVAYFSGQEYDSERKLSPRPGHACPGWATPLTEAPSRHLKRSECTMPAYAAPKVVSGERQSVETKRCAMSQRPSSPTGTKRSR